MNSNNYYDLLEIDKTSTAEDIKKAYKKLALKYHPDRGGNEMKFKEITEAYTVLNDENKRKDYDMFGNINLDNLQSNPFDIFEKMFKFSDDDIENMVKTSLHSQPKIFVKINKVPLNTSFQSNDDIFGNITNLFDDLLFGGNPINNKIERKEERKEEKKEEYDNIELKINLDDIINSNKKLIKYKISDICNTCNGTAAYDPNDLVICLYCSGSNNNCNSCNGKGNMFKTNRRCLNCKNGLIEKDMSINIIVPKGVPDNHYLVVKNKGSYNFNNKSYKHIKLKFIYYYSLTY